MAPSFAPSVKKKRGKEPLRSERSLLFQVLGAVALTAMAGLGYWFYTVRGCVTCPFPGAKLKNLQQFGPGHQNQLLWGTYRPGHYFGMKTREPKSLLFGMMWFDPDDGETVSSRRIRHKARQEDKLATYGWLQHDGRSYGHQQFLDQPFMLSTDMVKRFSEGSGQGGDWAVKVGVETGPGATEDPTQRLSLIFYFIDETGGTVNVMPAGKRGLKLAEGALLMSGSRGGQQWGLYCRKRKDDKSKKSRDHVYYLSGEIDEASIAELEQTTLMVMARTTHELGSETLQLPDKAEFGNVAMVQISFKLPSTYDLVFLSNHEENTAQRLQQLTGDQVDSLIHSRAAEFEHKFQHKFLESKTLGHENMLAMAALSNMVGGIGYFYGSSRIQMPPKGEQKNGEVVDYWPDGLYTAVPSRSFFPRGFLWDEGFHQVMIRRWDPAISRDILAHWLDLMNAQGWIPREQILGAEARSRVPEEFVVQHPTHANPPSMMLVLEQMANDVAAAKKAGNVAGDAALDEEFLRAAWPRLEVWYAWYTRTQQGPVPGSFRWHGRDATTNKELNPKTLMSGLDDYPRASHPSDDERHLDLLCWMALSARAMVTIGEVLGLPARRLSQYRQSAAQLSDPAHLKALHWDPERQMFADWGLHTEKVWLQKQAATAVDYEQTVRVVGAPPQLQFIPHFGYVSLFPILLRLLPPSSPLLPRQLELLSDPSLLWTPYGLRSLAPSSSLYNKYNTEGDKPYWRGPIWMNINYLAVSSLRWYCQEGVERACVLHKELAQGVLANVASQYEGTGYLWEQYNDKTGGPSGCHPFTGWTALVALMAIGV